MSWNPLDWLGVVKKAGDIGEKVTDGLFSGIDKLILTEEEKKDYSASAAKIYLEHQKVTLGESTVKSITRRRLATMVMGTYLGLLVFAVIVYYINPDYAKFILVVAGLLTTGFTAIIIFYFGYYAIGNLIDKGKGK